jgi:hypothetical protein
MYYRIYIQKGYKTNPIIIVYFTSSWTACSENGVFFLAVEGGGASLLRVTEPVGRWPLAVGRRTEQNWRTFRGG